MYRCELCWSVESVTERFRLPETKLFSFPSVKVVSMVLDPKTSLNLKTRKKSRT